MREVQWVRERADEAGNRAKEAFCSRDPRIFGKFMREAYADLDSCIREFHETRPPPFPSACGSGCWYCCHSRVLVSAPEAVYLARILKSQWSSCSRDRIVEQSARRRWAGGGRSEAWRSGVVCPLLAGGVCRVYAARPAACRGCNSMDSDKCRKAFAEGDAERLISRYAPQAYAAGLYRSALADAAEYAGLYAECDALVSLLPGYLDFEFPGRAWLEGTSPSRP